MSLADRELNLVLAGAGRPTPQTTVEAVMCAVRNRGLPALREPAMRERISRCDLAARAVINGRIAKLIGSSRRIAHEEASDAAV